MKFKCVDVRGRETVLTLYKIYEGYYKTVGYTSYIEINLCDDADYGIFIPSRFEVAE